MLNQRTARDVRRLENVYWFVFLIGAGGGFAIAQDLVGTSAPEQLIWLTGYLTVLLAFPFAIERLSSQVVRSWVLFSWPVLAILSSAWSLTPGLSLYHGIQLAMTMLIGLVLANRYRYIEIARILFWSLAVCLVLSLVAVVGALPFAIDRHGDWQGIYTHKNVLGAQTVLLFYTAAILFWSGWHRLLTAAAAAVSAIVIGLSGSATSLFALLAVCGMFPVLLLRQTRFVTAGAIISFGVAILMLIAAAFAWANLNPVDLALGAVGKNRTLTGRTVLWEFGIDAFREAPILGLGYKAYWASPATSGIYLKEVVQQNLWYFHNNYLEVAVALGTVGLLAFVAGLIAVTVVVGRRFVTMPEPGTAWPVLLLLHLLILTAVENPLFSNHSLMQVLLVAIAIRRPVDEAVNAGVRAPFSGRPQRRQPA